MNYKEIDYNKHAKVVGINENGLKKLILDIYSYRDKISKILEDAESIAESTKTFYKTEDGIEFREKFKKLSSNFSIVLSNIKSYGTDLERVLAYYKSNDEESVDIFAKKFYNDAR